MDGEPTKRPEPSKYYDYVIIGSGQSSLSFAALMVKAGKTVCILEAHDIPGGYAHSFKMGDYHFCAEVHYIWGCEPGGAIYAWLKKLGLEKDITFNKYDEDCYDLMAIPGKKVAIPMGYDKLIKNIVDQWPEDEKGIKRFVHILESIDEEVKSIPNEIKTSMIFKYWYKYPWLLKYRTKTLQDVYDECKLSLEVQTVLAAQAGDYMAPPNELSMLAYNGLFGGYNKGAYYPKKHYKYFVDRIAKFIEDSPGSDIFYETPVTKINVEGDKVVSYETKHGDVVKGDTYISNMDPQTGAAMIGWEHFHKKWHKPLKYDYSETGITIYLGLKDIDLEKYGFGKWNLWHCEQLDMNKMWNEMRADNFEKPWFFISTPTLHSKEPGTCPPGHEIIEICFFANYDSFKKLKDEDYNKYLRFKNKLAFDMIDLVEKLYIPDLKKHITMRVIGSPTTCEYYVKAPRGNAYGQSLTPKNIGLGRLKAKTPFKNFFWCNASSGFGGVHGTTWTGMQLYQDLTGDRFFDTENPEFIKKATLGRFFKVMFGSG